MSHTRRWMGQRGVVPQNTGLKESEEVRAPSVRWEGDVSGTPGRGPAWGPAFADACLSSPVFPIHLLLFHCHRFSVCHPIYICVFSATWASSLHRWLGSLSPSWAASVFALPCIGICSFSCPHGSLWVASVFISGPWFPSLLIPVSVISDAGLCPSIPASISVLRPATLSHFPLILASFPAPLSSSVPSSPLSPSPSAVSPTGSACCSPCSCTAVWGPWPGATSPQ